ncbi:MAG TPA: sugar phosphate isomerase/epimerase family protein [Chloroflexota bacterium]|nr:sugar phosphate isomerase/epimerase family protein [Chloroflexota bacterium]
MADAQDLRYRIGCGPGGANLEEGLTWAADNGFHFVEFGTDLGANAIDRWPEDRVQRVKALAREHDLHLGIHTLSAVNTAEFSPFMTDAVDHYLRANIDLAARLGAEHVIAHAGLHQSSQVELRKQSSLAHIKKAAEHAHEVGVELLLENMNREPDDAEVHYLGHTIDELRPYFEQIPELKWGFSANHAHLLPVDFDGFIDAFGIDRIGLVLVADCRGHIEEHLLPGEGTLDFSRLFKRLEGDGYRGPYTLTFGNREQRLAGRDYLLARAAGA